MDNNLYSFAFNLENGIPVQHYLGDINDSCLLQVMKYMKYIKDFSNLAEQNERIYDFRKVFNSDLQDYINFYYNDDNSSCDEYDTEVDQAEENLKFEEESHLDTAELVSIISNEDTEEFNHCRILQAPNITVGCPRKKGKSTKEILGSSKEVLLKKTVKEKRKML